MTLALGEYEGEPCVRLVVPSRPREEHLLVAAAAPAPRPEIAAGLMRRTDLLEALAERLATPSAGGVRCLAVVRIDKFAALERVVGVHRQRGSVHRGGAPAEGVAAPEGTGRAAWAGCASPHCSSAATSTTSAPGASGCWRAWPRRSCASRTSRSRSPAPSACRSSRRATRAWTPCSPMPWRARRKGITRGGNQSITSDRADNDSRVMSYDQVWVKHIKAALMENRFRLVQQPIASLQGDDPRMFDVLVRMIDTQGKEVLPSEFMAAAGRNDLLKNIDRWVVGRLAVLRRPEDPGVPVRAPLARDRARRRLHRLARQPPALQPRPAAAAVLPGDRGERLEPRAGGEGAGDRAARAALPLRPRGLRLRAQQRRHARVRAAGLREDRRHARAGAGRGPAAAAARARCWSKRHARTASRPSPSASRTPTPWRCCGRSACSTSRATSSTSPRKSYCTADRCAGAWRAVRSSRRAPGRSAGTASSRRTTDSRP